MSFSNTMHEAVKVVSLDSVDPMFTRMRAEAEDAIHREPEISGIMISTVLNHDSLESAIIHRLAARLGHPEVPGEHIRKTYLDVIAHDPSIGEAFRADLIAVVDRDPACARVIEPVLYFKGLSCNPNASFGACSMDRGPQGFRTLSAEPFV